MNLKTLQKEIKYLSFSRKLVLTGGFLGVLFLFLPWGHKLARDTQTGELIVDENTLDFATENFHAFGLFPVFGWILFLLMIVTLIFLGREMFRKKKDYKGISHSYWWLFLGGIGAYTIIIALFVLSSYAMKNADSESSVRIGVFLSLFAQCVLFSGGWVGRQDEQRAYVKDSLSRPHNIDASSVHLEAEPPIENQMSLGDYE